ncbi:tetraacyldisaccharide 4'-kinase [Bordetella genomosp. 5]|uniref:Tetraacyldisaccharide 4'-kinase n=1 Tax=Bordetella genomosp. 5 TaxID=1395608 RepID=A0A261TFK4_9BORD|nr:tetraacyldisaccharide 4'-kinase [Bordetella genomosp. 5]OZI48017.1 tetraacyldisaccharide 4'-kinase [Bordetella genomosp. 5]
MAAQGSFLARHWARRGWLARLLQPLAAIAERVVAAKRAAYRDGRRTAWRAPVPVVVVGNIYVGGTGKTPVVIAVAEGLRALGWHPGVVSRGYGVKIEGEPRVGQGEVDPARFGDEPALIAARTGAPISVHPRRADAAAALLRTHPEVDVIVSDDGLQHLALARDLEIVVQDARGIGNGLMLPAGPLREPPSRLDEVDAIVTNDATTPAPPATAATPRRVTMHLEPTRVTQLTTGDPRPLSAFAALPAARLAAVAGIGNPARFFATLAAAGVHPATTLGLPDHYAYTSSPFAGLSADTILITAKDAIKCAALTDPRLWVVEVGARFSDPGFLAWVDRRLRDATAR